MKYIQIQPLNENDWLEKRKQYITATQCIFAIKNFSTNQYCKELAEKYYLFNTTKYKFFYNKILTKEQQEMFNKLKEQKDYFKVGQILEDEVAKIGFEKIKKENQEYNNSTLTPNGRTIWTYEGANIMATPDYIIDINGTKEILECKTTEKDLSKDYNINKLVGCYNFQIQHQLLCSGLDYAWLVICQKTKEGDKLNGDCYIIKIKKNEKFFEVIKQSCNDCIAWINKNKENIEDEELKEPNLFDYEETCYYACITKELKDFVLQYKEEVAELKEKIKIKENIVELCKKIGINDIVIEGINIISTKQKDTYYTIENIDKDIEKKEEEIKKLKEYRSDIEKYNKQILKRKGSFILKDIVKVS